ncbi:MAG: M56 family metallopeptidase [Oscillatoriales cyanobacterium SM2_2_1]|nr:M56 family metallopeptidase [Oscillatoriales cyanobacterium SM2_2_1]
MHGMLVILGLWVPWMVRHWGAPSFGRKRVLGLLIFPAVWLTCTAIAIVGMGPHGHLMGIHCAAGWLGSFSGWWAWGWLLWAGLQGLRILLRAGQARELWQRMTTPAVVQGYSVWLWEESMPWAAQVGLWRSRIVISRGMVDLLSPEHLKAVLAHEAGHGQFRDPMWFQVWEWLMRCAPGFPHGESLWQEMLFQQEVRADRFAQAQTSGLLLAEALVLVQQHLHAMASPVLTRRIADQKSGVCAAVGDRLEERIKAMLRSPDEIQDACRWPYLEPLESMLAALPLAWIPLHIL